MDRPAGSSIASQDALGNTLWVGLKQDEKKAPAPRPAAKASANLCHELTCVEYFVSLHGANFHRALFGICELAILHDFS